MRALKSESTDKQSKGAEDRRNQNRKDIKAPIKVKFTLQYEGEVSDISKDGIAIKFHPLKTHSLDVGSKLWLQIDMQERIVSMNGEVRRISEKFGHIILGMQYERDALATFTLKDEESPSKAGKE